MKSLKRIGFLFVIVAALSVAGCSSGDGPTADTVKDIQGEMKKQTPADAKPMAPEEATKGMQMRGPKGKG